MTEKRFVIEDGYYQAKSRPLIYDNGSGDDDYYFCGDYDDFKDICKLLNELDSENQRLKLENDGLRYALKNIKQIDVEIDIGD